MPARVNEKLLRTYGQFVKRPVSAPSAQIIRYARYYLHRRNQLRPSVGFVLYRITFDLAIGPIYCEWKTEHGKNSKSAEEHVGNAT